MVFKNKILALMLTLLFFTACFSSKKTGGSSVEVSYDYDQINPRFVTWHFSDDSTRVYIKTEHAENDYTIEFSYFADIAGKQLVDSGTFTCKTEEGKRTVLSSGNKPLHVLKKNVFFFHLGSQTGKKNLLKIKITDLTSSKSKSVFIPMDKINVYSRQNFIAIDVKEEMPLFNCYVNDERFIVHHYKNELQKFSVKYFKHSFEPAPPAFFDQKMKPFEFIADSTFFVTVNDTISLEQEGIYHFQVGSEKEGFTLLRFDNDYPQVTTPENLAECLRYLTKNEEFEQMKESREKKLSVDTFWMIRGGDKDRAKVLIKEYYNRIQFANTNFTSYKAGWQTDRGLVYVIYGKPDKVYKYPNRENWTYNKTVTEAAVTFYFTRIENTFSDNHFYLTRNIVYEDSWNIATHKWRHGRINEITK